MYKSEQRRKAIGNCTLTSSKKTSIMSLLKRTYLCGKVLNQDHGYQLIATMS